jgi:4-hydroxybenzoate polyprenyltransferase
MNLVMVILTMLLVRYSVILEFSYNGDAGMLSPLPDFIILLITTLLITAGGYVINDYFDVRIDQVNRPDKVTMYSLISHHQAIKIHLVLNAIAVLSGFFLAWRVSSWSFGFIFPFIASLLWIYSARYKKVLFWGNFIVAALSSFVVILVWLYEFFWLHLNPSFFASLVPVLSRLTTWVLGYALFALLVTMAREIIKDMEDIEGDRKYDCRTIPVVIGIPMTRLLIGILVALTMGLLAFAQTILLRMELRMMFWYLLIAVQIPSAYLLYLLFRSGNKSDYHSLSLLCKIIMVAGILSMQIMIIE